MKRIVCSDTRCLTCTPWERAEAGYYDTGMPTWTESLRALRKVLR